MPNLASITLTQDIARPVDAVWRALTEPELVAKWWAPGDIAPEVGHAFTLNMGAFGEQKCTVTAVEPQELFAYTFGEGFLNTTITWRLELIEGGTRVYFEHAGFDLDSPVGTQAYQGMGGGWPQILGQIEATVGA